MGDTLYNSASSFSNQYMIFWRKLDTVLLPKTPRTSHCSRIKCLKTIGRNTDLAGLKNINSEFRKVITVEVRRAHAESKFSVCLSLPNSPLQYLEDRWVKRTVSSDFWGSKHLVSTFGVCPDGFQDLLKVFHYPTGYNY